MDNSKNHIKSLVEPHIKLNSMVFFLKTTVYIYSEKSNIASFTRDTQVQRVYKPNFHKRYSSISSIVANHGQNVRSSPTLAVINFGGRRKYREAKIAMQTPNRGLRRCISSRTSFHCIVFLV